MKNRLLHFLLLSLLAGGLLACGDSDPTTPSPETAGGTSQEGEEPQSPSDEKKWNYSMPAVCKCRWEESVIVRGSMVPTTETQIKETEIKVTATGVMNEQEYNREDKSIGFLKAEARSKAEAECQSRWAGELLYDSCRFSNWNITLVE